MDFGIWSVASPMVRVCDGGAEGEEDGACAGDIEVKHNTKPAENNEEHLLRMHFPLLTLPASFWFLDEVAEKSGVGC
jgi:hypothetical protein